MRVVDRWDEVEALLTDCRSLELPANPQRLLQRIDDEQAKLAETQTEPFLCPRPVSARRGSGVGERARSSTLMSCA